MESYFRTSPIHSAVRHVDRKANIIFGAKIIQLGRVNDDRPYVIDEETLSQVLAFGQAKPNGIKSRFTHPNLCNDGLGRHLGRWKHFRREDDSVLADLHIAESSFNTPHGDLGGYVLDMAEEDPEAFGVSIASTLTEAMRNQIDTWDESQGGLIPYRLQALNAADVVGDPAATRGGLFSIESISDRRDVPHFVSQFLATYFAGANPQVVASKVIQFLSAHYGVPIELEPAQATTTPQEKVKPTSSMESYKQAFGDEGFIYFGKGMSLAECYGVELGKREATVNELRETIAQREESIASLEDRLSVAKQLGGF